MALAATKDRGFDVVIEAVGTIESFAIAQALVGAGGTIASLGVFGGRTSFTWRSCGIAYLYARASSAMIVTDFLLGLRTRLIDAVSTPDLLKMVESGAIDPHFLVSHSESRPFCYP